MSATINAFPTFTDGNVMTVLSEEPSDTLVLHTTTLAKAPPFFEASLERLEWSHNKYDATDSTERQIASSSSLTSRTGIHPPSTLVL